MLQVKLLGQFDVRLNDQPIELESRPAQSLLAYLVLTAGTAHRREKLAGLLWPDTSEANARRSLRQALWHIRKAIGAGGREYLLADGISVAFDATSEYWLDVRDLEKKAAGACSPDDLIDVVSVYGGHLLPGFYDEWVVLERERLQAIFEQKMGQLLECLLREQRWEDVLEWGERWIALGQIPEPAYCALMVAHSALGDTSKVAAVYQRCAESMRKQLSVEPSEQTRALFKQLSSGEKTLLSTRAPTRTSTRPSPIAAEEPPAPMPPASLPQPPFLSSATMSPAPPAPFVDREREMAQLDEFLGMVLSGRGQVVLITGEAGSGKTALAHEFARRAQEAHADLIVAHGDCNAHTGIGDPYLPFREVLGLLTGDFETKWTGSAITRENARRLWTFMSVAASALVDVGPDLIDSFVPGATLVTRAANLAPNGTGWLERLKELAARQMGPAGGDLLEQSHIFEQYTNVLQAMAAQRPLLLILDDLHWADVSSISLLFHLSRRIEESRILIVGSYRPEDVTHGWEGKPHPLQGVLSEFKRYFSDIWVDLDRAVTVKGRRFVDALLDTEPNRLGEAFRQALYRHSEGHALFTTELLQDMRERGDLQQDEEGRWVEGRAVDWETMPTRVEGVIEKRIHRLPTELRQALLVASVEGEEFTAELVARVQAVNEREFIRRLSGELDRQHHLVSALDIHWLGPQRLSRYRFRHDLFQKYLYHTLDAVERAYLHEQVGNVLESLYGNWTEQIAVQLARHFQAAGNVEKAVDYLLQVGEKARRLSANEEAISHFNQGLALVKTLPDTPERAQRELALQLGLGNALTVIKGYAAMEVGQAYSRARELCRQLGDTPQLFPALSGVHRYFQNKGMAQLARELGEELVNLAQNGSDPALFTYAHSALGGILWFTGEFAAAQAHFEKGIALYDSRRHPTYAIMFGDDPGVTCLCYAAWALWFLGYPDQALNKSQEALTLAQELSHPYSLAHALSLAAISHQFRREGQATQMLAEDATALSLKHGFPFWLASGTVLLGWALTEHGKREAGIAEIREGLSAWRRMGIEVGQTYFLALLAEAYQKVGQAAEGLAVIAEALSVVSGFGRWWETELYRLKGELLLAQSVGGIEADECFRQAIEIARRQGAKSLELRAVMSLSRLWRAQGKHVEARQLLAEIYSWFTEGFDTADLKEARALLQMLS